MHDENRLCIPLLFSSLGGKSPFCYAQAVFKTRSLKPERIDTGDYTPSEYKRFLKEIRFINQRLGDRSALESTLLAEVTRLDLREFSVLDVGAGTGELLGVIADFPRDSGRTATLVGLDLNDLSIREVAAEAKHYRDLRPVQGDALALPFADNAFDYAFCSLFTHHLTDGQIPIAVMEMSRVARRGILVIDLERSAKAWVLYQLFCMICRISPLVRQDGSLSIRKGFTCEEMNEIGRLAGFENLGVSKHTPYRVVLKTFG